MKCVILAGGRGTRISELTKNIPKPMIKISGKPLLYHIMKHYANYGIKDFIVAAGYKKNIIVQDEFDQGQRMLLNFGHTIGHALESYYQYKNIMHGDAVYHGMVAASYISCKLGYLSRNDYNVIYEFINSIPKKTLDNIDIEIFKNYLLYDKKRTGNKSNFILLNNIGSAIIRNDIPELIINESLKLLIN